jgi:deazaflavin-dependent oxidoreductase (nitroreductase family)
MPLWFGHVNKRFFNKMELKRGVRPVLNHVGRSSGKRYRTPLDAHRVNGGYLFILVYGSGSDWVKNVLAAGTAVLEIDGDEIDLVSPRLVSRDAAWELMPEGTKAPPSLLRVNELLQMDIRR